MDTLNILLFILFIVVIVTAISENINVPYPILLVIAGLLVAMIPNLPKFHIHPEIVLTLFLPPILFSAAGAISWHDIRSQIISIVSLSFVLVAITAFSVAFALHLAVPNIAFSTALILGAIISPTDVAAANSILSKMHVKQEIIQIIKVESLFNDTCSILLYKAALLAVLSQSLSATILSFHLIVTGLGGILVGIVFAFVSGIIIETFLTDSENDLPIIMSLLLAYICYLFSIEIGVSGVLAVVTAGLMHKKTIRSLRADTRLAERTIWDGVLFFLNGLIFISIGLEFPTFLKKVNYLSMQRLFILSVLTIVVITILRFLWAWVTDVCVQLWKQYRTNQPFQLIFHGKELIVITWSGMRGLVSLALAVALPLTLPDEMPFPARDLIIILTIITILFTLVGQGLTLPFLIRKLKLKQDKKLALTKTGEIYRYLTQQALESVEQLSHHPQVDSEVAKKLVKNHYTNRLLGLYNHKEAIREHHLTHEQAELLLARCLQYERDLLLEMRHRDEISEEIYIRVLQKLDRDEVSFASNY